jgi:2',3'-cyclic-nucleotide 2'-phosphodiesterase
LSHQGIVLKEKISVLFIGDVVGKPGLKALQDYLPTYIQRFEPDLVVVNGENAADGKGITDEESEQIFVLGCDIITTGNHVWDNWKGKSVLSKTNKILRPLNYPPGNPGYGYTFHKIEDGPEVAVLNLQGRTFMQAIDCPFRAADFAVNSISERTKIIIVDFHADATAEKVAMGWHLDGRVSAMIGTHTHIQTADSCILPNGSAYVTDVGMTGPYNSVVGLRKDIALKRFILQTPYKFEMADGDVRICGTHIVIDALSGAALSIETFMWPEAVKKIRN